jgi:hypothetical protein
MVPRIEQSGFRVSAMVTAAALCWWVIPALSQSPEKENKAPKNDYPTSARVEYVQECIRRNGGNLADLYKCSCVIDRLAEHLTYDEFVEAGTFARYSTLPGEGGGIFRDPDRAKEKAKLYRNLETEAYRACGLQTR